MNDCINAWPITHVSEYIGEKGGGCGTGPWSWPLFMTRDIGFAIVSITRIDRWVLESESEDLIFDQRTLEGLGNLYNSLVHSHPVTKV